MGDSGVNLATSEAILTTSEVLQPTSEVIDVDEGFIDTSEAATDPMVEDQTLIDTLQEKLRWVFYDFKEKKIFKTRYLNKVKKEGSVFSWYFLHLSPLRVSGRISTDMTHFRLFAASLEAMEKRNMTIRNGITKYGEMVIFSGR